RRSEATRSGLALTKWAINLSLLIGVIYIMYYAGTYFAVQAQARPFADAWLKKISEGKIDEAYFETTRAPRTISRKSDESEQAALRRKLEVEHNAADPNMRGIGPGYSGFTVAEFVRLLRIAGDKAVIEREGLKDWDYEKGAYRVTYTYRVTTDLATFPLLVTVFGPVETSSGRMWQVLLD